MRKVMTVLGTRPELIKMSRVMAELDRQVKHVMVHSGQNYDFELNQVFFDDLEIRKPDYFLGAAGATASKTIAEVITKVDDVFAIERPDAVLATWFLGHEAGNAVADVLTGRFNPTGRLPVSWPRDVGQVPIFYNELPSGRPYAPGVHYSSTYLDLPPTPQFPFGHGLSYSRFALNDLRCERTRVKAGATVEVTIAVHNESQVDGEATAFLFVRDPVASVARPLLELKGVQKVDLKAGERKDATWRLPVEDLSFVGNSLDRVLESGRFEIHIGQSADPSALVSCAIELAK